MTVTNRRDSILAMAKFAASYAREKNTKSDLVAKSAVELERWLLR
jgi:hypothetical protein